MKNIKIDKIVEITMTAENGFLVSYETDNVVQAPLVFSLPKKISLWQIGMMNEFFADMIENCKNTGKVLGTALVTTLKTGDPKVFNAVFTGLQKAASGDLMQGAVVGIGDLLKFFNVDRLTHVAAVLFLLPGEMSLGDDEMKERKEIFKEFHGEILWKGLMGFFGSKLSQIKSSPLLSKIFEAQKNEPSIVNSQESTGTSTIIEDSLTPSQRDIPSESVT